MEQLFPFIKDYLVIYKSLSLGKLGTFKIAPISAKIHPIIHSFEPPSAEIEFIRDENCHTEYRFLQYLIIKNDISEPEAVYQIKEFVHAILTEIDLKGIFTFHGLGKLSLIDENQFAFETYPDILLNTESFGLPAFTAEVSIQKPSVSEVNLTAWNTEKGETENNFSTEMKGNQIQNEENNISEVIKPKISEDTIVHPESEKEEVLKEDVFLNEAPLEQQHQATKESSPSEKIPQKEDEPKKIKSTSTKKVRRRIAILSALVLVLSGFTVVVYFTDILKRDSFVKTLEKDTNKPELKNNHINNPPVEDDTRAKVDTTSLSVEPDHNSTNVNSEGFIAREFKYYVVAGCYLNKELADRNVSQLQAQGYTNAGIVGKNAAGLFVVVFSGYDDKNKAVSDLQEIMKTGRTDIWLMTK